jgi:2-polyprenyl-3-methyl-5-hydroxy-6-metoxy-1,4-benzoquinol methylase
VQAVDRFWGIDGSFSYGACPECGSWILDPRPAPEAMGPFYAAYYPEHELEARRTAMQKHPPQRALGLEWLRALDAVKRLKKLGAGLTGRLLDAGCGAGAFLRSMREQTAFEVRGVDFDPKCQALAAEIYDVPVDTGELAAQAYPDGQFDVVSSWHCLEHVYDPVAELEELARVLAPGGHLLLEVPTPGLLGRLFKGRWLYLQAPTHLYLLRPETVRALVVQAGLEVQVLRRPWLPTEFAGSVLMALGLKGFAPRLLPPKPRGTDRLWRWGLFALLVIDVPLTFVLHLFGDGGVVQVIARKPEAAS